MKWVALFLFVIGLVLAVFCFRKLGALGGNEFAVAFIGFVIGVVGATASLIWLAALLFERI